jgi:hypothetical protein
MCASLRQCIGQMNRLLLGSRIQRSPSNPALCILPRAFADSADATQGIG